MICTCAHRPTTCMKKRREKKKHPWPMDIQVSCCHFYTKTAQRNTVTGSTSCQHKTMFPGHPIIPEQGGGGRRKIAHFQSVLDLEYIKNVCFFPRWTTLPRLRERNKCWTKFGILYPTSDVSLKTSLVPIPPRLTKETKPVLENPPVPHFSQLSQSAPSLDASFLLQVRTNIHNSKCWENVKNDHCNK